MFKWNEHNKIVLLLEWALLDVVMCEGILRYLKCMGRCFLLLPHDLLLIILLDCNEPHIFR